MRRGVEFVGGVIEVILDLLTLGPQRIGAGVGGILVRATFLGRFNQIGFGLVAFIDRLGDFFGLVLGGAVARCQRQCGREQNGGGGKTHGLHRFSPCDDTGMTVERAIYSANHLARACVRTW